MKSILIISTLTFLVIFGVILITNGLFESAMQDLNRAVAESGQAEPDDMEAEQTLYMNMARERDQLQREREADLARRTMYDVEEKLLDEREAKIAAMISELQSAQAAFAAGSDAQATKLSKVYEAMKPAQAAPILSSLDLDIVLPILRNMKDRQAAKILAAMNPALAAEISTRLSVRGLDAGKGAG